MKKKIVYFDMDGVLADYYGRATYKDNPELEADDFFENLPPIKGSVEAFKRLSQHFDCYILTTVPWSAVGAGKGKRLWVEKHLGEFGFKRLMTSHHKNLHIGDYLIDDRIVNGAGEFTGEHIHFGTPQFPDWDAVVEYIEKENKIVNVKKKKIVAFTGAGISKESGVLTFRDVKDGLWNNHKIYDVATPEGWRKNREAVLEFYNERRRQMPEVEPNDGHKILASLEDKYDVTVVTQNVDDLHERGGSTNIIHLHGELTKARGCMYGGTSALPSEIYDIGYNDIKIGDKCKISDSQLRPHIVWFGEYPFGVNRAYKAIEDADYLLIVGTSLNIGYTLQMLGSIGPDCKVIYIDPHPALGIEKYVKRNVSLIQCGGAEGMAKLVEKLNNGEL